MPVLSKSVFSSNRVVSKLFSMTMSVSGVCLLLASVAYTVINLYDQRASLVQHTSILANIIADSTSATLALGDADAATERLLALRADNAITHASLYNKQGRKLAEYRLDRADASATDDIVWSLPDKPSVTHLEFHDYVFDYILPIKLDGELVGQLHIRSDLSLWRQFIMERIAVSVMLLVLLFFVVFVLTTSLQRRMTKPMAVLARSAREVADNKNGRSCGSLQPGHQRLQPAVTGSGAIRSHRILVADGDPAFRKVVAEHLRAAGFDVSLARSGDEAFELAGQFQPDLILLDATIDGLSGYDACHRLGQDKVLSSIPVVMVTRMDDMDSVNQAFNAGARDFICRPVNYPMLIKHLHFILRSAANEMQLRENESKLKTAQRMANLGYWRIDLRSDNIEISDHLADMCDLVPGGAYAIQHYEACIDENDRALFRETLNRTQQDGAPASIEYSLLDTKGGRTLVRQDTNVSKLASGAVVIGVVQDITRQKAVQEQIRRMAYFDTLTGLASRSYFMQHLNDAINNAHRHNHQVVLLFLDLDGFKDINDALGHNTGDYLLTVIASRLKTALRDADFIARLGGDEFCVLLDECADNHEAIIVAEKCLQAIHETIELASRNYSPKASIGIARYPEDAANMDDLLKAADSAMYAAKHDGKHCYAFYDPSMTSRAEQRMMLEMDLKQAFANNEFELHYQPQIDFHDGRMVGVEALARWIHPERGMVPPDQFIPVLEQIGMISDFGEWVINTACKQLKHWREQGLARLSMAVNISPLHFSDGSLANNVSRALATNHIPADLLEIEITESMIQTGDAILHSFDELKEIGVTIAIDDFGTGYSSLGSLKNLPIDRLKIDRLFINDISHHADDNIMLGTIFGMAHALNYKVVAEGVETEEQTIILAGLGCDIAQGYYFSRPVTADQIPKLYFTVFQPASDSSGVARR